MSHDFLAVPTTTRPTSSGPVELPIRYQDASNIMALFGAPVAGAAALLEESGLEPAIVAGGQALVGLSFYEYRRTSIGDYNEVGTAIFARRPGGPGAVLGLAELLLDPRRRRVGAWVVDLPVTTEAACAAGRELWGYPKFVTGIDFSLSGRELHGRVREPDGEKAICELSGHAGPSVPVPGFSILTYSRLEGELLATPVDVKAPSRVHLPGEVRLRVGPSAHPMAAHLRTLGLDGASPLLLVVTGRFRSLLHAGEAC